jgi:hypothetical protein
MPLAEKPLAGHVVSFTLALAALGCKAKPSPAAPSASASVASSAAKPAPADAPARCRSVGSGPALRVGDAERRPPTGDDSGDDPDEDDEAAMPFATRVDAAAVLDDAFAVGGLTTPSAKTEAFVAWVPFAGGPGRRVSLGPVHGDVDPPRVAGRGHTVLAAVADMDAGGGMLRLERVDEASEKASGDASLTGVDHDVGAALAWGEHGALLVFGAKRAPGGGLKLVTLDPEKLGGPFTPRDLEGTLHAESPVLVARPGGYWLAWVAETPPGEKTDAGAQKPTKPDAGTRGAAPRASGAPNDAEEDAPLVESGPRVLMTLPLDAAGKSLGVPRAVSAPRVHVVGFEAALAPDGALVLTFRENEASPGVESGPPDLARVTLDGAIGHAKLEDEDLSAGLPALLADTKTGGRTWVALESASGGTRIGVLKEPGLGLESLVGDRLLRGADVLAAGDGKLLVSRNRGRAVELEVLECKPSP